MKINLEQFSEVIVFGAVILFISIIIDAGVISFAEGEETTEETEYTTVSDCSTEITGALEEKSAEFLESSQTALSSTGTTTQVIEEAINPLVEEFSTATDEIFATATANLDREADLTKTTEDLATCQAIVEKEVENNEVILKTMVSSSASAKQTTALLDEYKWINENLREMLETVGYVNAYFSKISSSFEFTKTCVGK